MTETEELRRRLERSINEGRQEALTGDEVDAGDEVEEAQTSAADFEEDVRERARDAPAAPQPSSDRHNASPGYGKVLAACRQLNPDSDSDLLHFASCLAMSIPTDVLDFSITHGYVLSDYRHGSLGMRSMSCEHGNHRCYRF